MKPNTFSALIMAMAVFLAFALQKNVHADDYIHGYFIYTIEDESVTITDYTGSESVVTIPAMIGGNPVNTIASGAFADSETVVTVNLPETVTSIEAGAFNGQNVVYYSVSPGEDAVQDGGNTEEADGQAGTNGGEDSGAVSGNGTADGSGSSSEGNTADGQYEEADVSLPDDGRNESSASGTQQNVEESTQAASSDDGNAQSVSADTEAPEAGNGTAQSENTASGSHAARIIVPVVIIIAAAVCAGVIVKRRRSG